MRGAVAATLVMAAGAAISAEPSVAVEKGLSRFERICTAAIRNPQAYVDTIPSQGPLGNQTVSVSPDGQIIMTSFAQDGLIQDVVFLRLPGSLTVYCLVHDDHTAPDSALGHLATEEAIAAHTQALAQAFEALMAGRPEIAMVGGNIPLEFSAVYDGVAQRGAIPYNYRYGYNLEVEGRKIPSLIEIAYASAAYQTIHRIEVPE
jgi:hypothetical protein